MRRIPYNPAYESRKFFQRKWGIPILDRFSDIIKDRTGLTRYYVNHAIENAGPEQLYDCIIGPAVDRIQELAGLMPDKDGMIPPSTNWPSTNRKLP